jgi:hypothetical protein
MKSNKKNSVAYPETDFPVTTTHAKYKENATTNQIENFLYLI